MQVNMLFCAAMVLSWLLTTALRHFFVFAAFAFGPFDAEFL